MLKDRGLMLERPHPLGGVQRIYCLPNGYGLSLVNCPDAHRFPYAWEAAVLTCPGEYSRWAHIEGGHIAYDTPLTSNVEVFLTDDEANAFIDRAFAWAESDETAPSPH